MTDLLLITDIPRLIQLFSQLSSHNDLRLRTSTSLDSTAREIAAGKPSVIFIQTHLSGISAEILLMHLKKQLGRQHPRFVLLSAPGQVSEEVLNQYQGHINTALDDEQLYNTILDTIHSTDSQNHASEPEPAVFQPDSTVLKVTENIPQQNEPTLSTTTAPDTAIPSTTEENSLVEQGVVYSPRSKLSVYSEFTSSFDNAVSSMPSREQTNEPEQWQRLADETIVDVEQKTARPKWLTAVLWAIPLLAIAVGITMLQQYLSSPKPLDIAPAQPVPPADKIAAMPKPEPTATTAPAAEPAGRIKEAPPTSSRPAKLPAFIPREGVDRKYQRANPGWERYRGKKTEYKVFREGGSIKAIQVIDRGGKGITDKLQLSLLNDIVANPAFKLESTEKKDSYAIQRGRLAGNIAMVNYRDTGSGILRAFVVTWD